MQLNPFHRHYRRKIARAWYASAFVTCIRDRLANNRKGVLVYAGVHRAGTFARIFTRYEFCYGFEADPELCAKLQHQYRYCDRVRIFNYAVADYDGEISFNICNAKGCSSLGKFSENWQHELKMIKTITVPCINLFNFLQDNKVHEIEDYVSDIQGFDLQALKMLKPFIDNGKIKTIQSEVSLRSLYKDIPDNSEAGFTHLLGGKYECIARICSRELDKTGGLLRTGTFGKIPEKSWDMDCKWMVKAQ